MDVDAITAALTGAVSIVLPKIRYRLDDRDRRWMVSKHLEIEGLDRSLRDRAPDVLDEG